jgi:hypothetical protein
MPITNVVQTSDVPQSSERLTSYADDYVCLMPVEGERETLGQTRFGERPSVRVQAYVYKEKKAFNLGIIPVFQGTIRALIRYASANGSVVAGIMHKEGNRWVFTHDPANKEHAAALKAIGAKIDSGDEVQSPDGEPSF